MQLIESVQYSPVYAGSELFEYELVGNNDIQVAKFVKNVNVVAAMKSPFSESLSAQESMDMDDSSRGISVVPSTAI